MPNASVMQKAEALLALDRIEAALTRIETAAAAPPPAARAHDDLRRRHEDLKTSVARSLADLDDLLAGRG